jgi:hypothetical protein
MGEKIFKNICDDYLHAVVYIVSLIEFLPFQTRNGFDLMSSYF